MSSAADPNSGIMKTLEAHLSKREHEKIIQQEETEKRQAEARDKQSQQSRAEGQVAKSLSSKLN